MNLKIRNSAEVMPMLAYQPVIKEGIPDFDPDSAEYDRYWKEQWKRCLEGYQPSGYPKISGKYYFHLNFWIINREIMLFDAQRHGAKINSFPLYRDIDHEFFDWKGKLLISKKNGIIGKRRRIGATDNNISSLAYEMIFFRANQVALGVPTQANLNGIMPKFFTGWNNLPDAFRMSFIQEDNTKGVHQAGFSHTDELGKRQSGSMSLFWHQNFTRAGQFKGKWMRELLIDEAGEFANGKGKTPSLKQCYLESIDCVGEGKSKIGTIMIAGTSDRINNDSMDYEELIYHADEYNLEYFFIPATKWYYPMVDIATGKSNEKKAREDILNEREKLMQLEDKTAIYKYMQNYPLTTEEMFVVSSSSQMDMWRINERIEAILGSADLRDFVKVGNLVDQKDAEGKVTGKVEFEMNKQGRFRITMFPINHQYKGADIGGVDDYLKDKAPSSDSLGAIVIYRRFISADVPCKIPVAIYHYRPHSRNDFFADCLRMAKFYDCQLAIEKIDTGLYEYFKRNNALKYLKQYPLIMGERSNVLECWGYNVKEKEKDIMRTKFALFSESQELNNVHDLKILRQMTEFDKKNTDVMSAWGICLLYDDDLDLGKVKVSKIEVPDKDSAPKVVVRRISANIDEYGGKVVPNYGELSKTMIFPWQKALIKKNSSS